MKKALIEFLQVKQGVILQLALGAIMVFFIGVLIAVYFISKQANPIILDEKGRPLQTESQSHNY